MIRRCSESGIRPESVFVSCHPIGIVLGTRLASMQAKATQRKTFCTILAVWGLAVSN